MDKVLIIFAVYFSPMILILTEGTTVHNSEDERKIYVGCSGEAMINCGGVMTKGTDCCEGIPYNFREQMCCENVGIVNASSKEYACCSTANGGHVRKNETCPCNTTDVSNFGKGQQCCAGIKKSYTEGACPVGYHRKPAHVAGSPALSQVDCNNGTALFGTIKRMDSDNSFSFQLKFAYCFKSTDLLMLRHQSYYSLSKPFHIHLPEKCRITTETRPKLVQGKSYMIITGNSLPTSDDFLNLHLYMCDTDQIIRPRRTMKTMNRIWNLLVATRQEFVIYDIGELNEEWKK